MRENVLGLTVIDAHGEWLPPPSRARKSSAGYDLPRLMIGSEGTLGLICAATLRVHPIPEATVAAQCTFPPLDAAVRCVVRVAQHAIPGAPIELADELQIEAINRHNEMTLTVAPTLFIEFHGGSDADVEAQAVETAEIAAEYRGRCLTWASDKGPRPRLWDA